MLAWINSSPSIYMLVVGAIFLLITTDANPTEIPYKECPEEVITVGTRVDSKKNDRPWCSGCDELRNCTSVFGSVHLKGISFNKRNEHLRKELRFPHLREITGHLIVTFLMDGTSLSDILPNLAVIHGRVESLFQGYALVIYQNEGLQNLGLNSLTVIKQGGIKIEFNPKLCYLDRIRWQSLMDYREAKELAMNGNSKDCFAKCSEFCHTPSGHGSSGHKYCWGRERKNCQKLCHSKCGPSGCEDGSQDKCCDKECLGGCTQAHSPHHCNACQHFRIGNGSCMAACPPGLKEVEKVFCTEKCPKEVALEVNGKCYEKCPAGYKSNGTKCDKCDNCPRVCTAPQSRSFTPRIQKIKTLSDSAKLKGCEILNGNLEIEMRNVPGGANIAKVLTEHLGSLKKINGYLVVRQSTPLISLNFFKNLTRIVTRGDGFSPKDYALAIFDNPNLESLWDFHPDFKIIGNGQSPEKDGVFVQLNPRLCLYNIYPLIENVLKLNRSDPAVDISETTNGNARICNVHLVNITITPLGCSATSLCVRVSWPNNKANDYRNVLLYSVWYRETTSTDLNEYDDIDACNSDHVWNRQDVEARQSRRPIISKTVSGLKAYTLYAFRVEAIVIAGTGVKSSITYFKTKQTKPSVPRSLEVSFLSSSSLQVKWKKPFFPNGEITHYVVRYRESQSSYLWNIKIDWCEIIDSSINFNEKREEKDEGTSMNNSCPVNITCDCENEKNIQSTPDLKEELFAKEFQDTILTTVFTKKDDNDKDRTTPRPSTLTLPNVVRNKTTSISQGCDNNNKNSSCSSASPNTKTLATSNPTTVMSTSPQPTAAPVITLNTISQTTILTGLKYFTDYTVEVCACNVGAGCGENRLFRTQCSTAIGRTEKNDMADNVGDSLKYTAKKSSREFTLDWEAPVRPNFAILRYDIWIQYQNIKENKTITDETECVLSSKTTYTKHGASFGDYTARVRAITPVGNGSWSNEVSFKITEPPSIRKMEMSQEFFSLQLILSTGIAQKCTCQMSGKYHDITSL